MVGEDAVRCRLCPGGAKDAEFFRESALKEKNRAKPARNFVQLRYKGSWTSVAVCTRDYLKSGCVGCRQM